MVKAKLNLGGGSASIPGFENIDRKTGGEVYPLARPDGSADQIRASHVIEHLSFADAEKALADWFRVLAPGGSIFIAVPDAEKIAGAIASGDTMAPFYLMGGQTGPDDFHRSCWTRERLTAVMRLAGFDSIEEWKSDGLDTSAHKVSLNLQAKKPDEQVQDVQICAAMSLPRLGWNDTWGSIVDALTPFRIPVRRYTGAFWGQCLQGVLEDCIADGIDWVLCIDYDSLFTPKQLDRLLGTFGANPHIDALAALQPKRNDGTPLMSIKGSKGVTVDGSPIMVNTAHFGLTLIRLDALAEIEKPWFFGKPGPDGTWNHPEKIDDDIWFWHQWNKHGKTVAVDPCVRLGHLELMVSQFNQNMELERITVSQWRERKDQ